MLLTDAVLVLISLVQINEFVKVMDFGLEWHLFAKGVSLHEHFICNTQLLLCPQARQLFVPLLQLQ